MPARANQFESLSPAASKGSDPVANALIMCALCSYLFLLFVILPRALNGSTFVARRAGTNTPLAHGSRAHASREGPDRPSTPTALVKSYFVSTTLQPAIAIPINVNSFLSHDHHTLCFVRAERHANSALLRASKLLASRYNQSLLLLRDHRERHIHNFFHRECLAACDLCAILLSAIATTAS